MVEPKRDRIELIDQQIVNLMLERKQAVRLGNLKREQKINEQIDKLELEIKSIKEEV